MPQADLYRVVEANWGPEGRAEKDIGCAWEPQRQARERLRKMKLTAHGRTLSLQKQERRAAKRLDSVRTR